MDALQQLDSTVAIAPTPVALNAKGFAASGVVCDSNGTLKGKTTKET